MIAMSVYDDDKKIKKIDDDIDKFKEELTNALKLTNGLEELCAGDFPSLKTTL